MLEYLLNKKVPHLCFKYKNNSFLSHIILHVTTDEVSWFHIDTGHFHCLVQPFLRVLQTPLGPLHLFGNSTREGTWRISKQVSGARWKCWSHGRRNEVSDQERPSVLRNLNFSCEGNEPLKGVKIFSQYSQLCYLEISFWLLCKLQISVEQRQLLRECCQKPGDKSWCFEP